MYQIVPTDLNKILLLLLLLLLLLGVGRGGGGGDIGGGGGGRVTHLTILPHRTLLRYRLAVLRLETLVLVVVRNSAAVVALQAVCACNIKSTNRLTPVRQNQRQHSTLGRKLDK